MARRVAASRLVPAAAAVGALLLVAASPTAVRGDTPTVAAATAGLTITSIGPATLEVPGGGDPDFDPTSDVTVVGTLPVTTVTDVRTFGGSWTVTASATAFVHADEGDVEVPASAGLLYLDGADLGAVETDLLGLGLLGSSIDAATLSGSASNLGVPYTLIRGSTGLFGGTIIYVPVLRVVIPMGTPAGTYTATIIQTVS